MTTRNVRRKKTIKKDNNKKIFITYGNAKFKKSRERLKKEALSLNVFDEVIVETNLTIKSDLDFKKALEDTKFSNVFKRQKGGGYWIWKPYVVYKHLKKLKTNDILVYADSGCSIKKTNAFKFIKTFNLLKKGKKKIILNKLKSTYEYSLSELKEKMWSKGDILNYYKVYNNDKILNSVQYEGGRIFIIKNDKTMKMIKKWWETAKKHPELFDDSASKKPNKDEFIETRHDQSNISILCKINSDICLGSDLSFISDTRIKD